VGLKSDGTVVAVGDNYYDQCNVSEWYLPPCSTTITLTTSSSEGGTVTTPGIGNFSYTYGENASITANATSCYHFVNWSGNTYTIADVNNPNTTITMNGNYSITANFAINSQSLTTASGAGGNVTTPGEGTYNYDCGSSQNIVATANSCYHFVNWSGDTGNISNPNDPNTTITMNGNYSIQANFASNTVQLTTNSSGSTYYGSMAVQLNAGNDDAHENSAGGSFSSTTTAVYLSSNSVSSARYNGGFIFDNVSIPHGATITSANISSYVFSTSFDDANVKIYGNDLDNANNFTTEADVTSRICTTAYTSWVSNSLGTGWKTSPNISTVIQEIVDRASWTKGNSLGIIVKGNSNTSKYLYVYSYNNGAAYGAKLNVSYTFYPGGLVTTPGQPGPYTYNCGTNVSILATPNSGCRFVNWTGSGVDAGKVANPNAASTTINMDGNYSVQANFAVN
jgi:hypothetical protein